MKQRMPILGAHMSVAGGLYKAVDAAASLGMGTVQIFTKNNNQWNCKPLDETQISDWQQAMARCQLVNPIAHTSYLINLASPDDALWQKSIDALVIEWQRADTLQLDGLVMHPGAFTTSNEQDGTQRIIDGVLSALEAVEPQTTYLLLENTAGQGSCLGHQISQLGQMLKGIGADDSVGVCFDTCHAFAAGYDFASTAGFKAMKREINNELPKGAIRALHLNDSKKGCGSRVDRHEHIGLGELGDGGFEQIFSDPMFRKLPGYLETEKGEDPETKQDWDLVNLQRLQAIYARVD